MHPDPQTPMLESRIRSLPLLHRGKVRDTYAVGEDRLLIVTTDRISAFDVVMDEPIPGKGAVLNAMSNFWFALLADLGPNHLLDIAPESVVRPEERDQVAGRAVVARRLIPLPVEAVVRGYLIGSGWNDYCDSGAVCGIALPAGLQQAQQLPEPIFTPAHKAPVGEHDENISFAQVCERIGAPLAERMRDFSLQLYRRATEHAAARGIIIADTKFEFGLDHDGTLRLMDEVLTPDSSRFWPADQYRTGISPPSFDKQFLRDWLQTQPWSKTPPPPALPREIVEKTAARYREALDRLTGELA
ncbi:phosphoribosylaminoimidazole-succinocarboxamide synthase [Burkholderiales bacterium GJ-E10]|nr:phosphoribosylaminoimidazole-succinocarboxamide synthase [Burkholderiales bacterium GJ-E10]